MTGKDLRIVFMGTPEFAVESLKKLYEGGYQIVGVITAPDRPAGRGQKLHESEVKQYATSVGLPVFQPEKLKDSLFLEQLRTLKADLQIVVAFRMLPEVVWNMPPLGTFNLHGSLLPRYRGAAPLNWAVINGDQETGVTTFLLKHEIDTGNILFNHKIEIGEEDTVGDIYDRLMVIGADLVIKTVEALAEGTATPIPQDISSLSPAHLHAPKLFKEDCLIDWTLPATTINNRIRGLSPYPTAYTNLDNGNGPVSLKIFKGRPEEAIHQLEAGTIVSDQKKYLKIACADGFVYLLDIQLAGKKRMSIEDFLRGFPNAIAYSAK